MLILECSQGCYGRTEGRTDGSVTISLRNFVGEVIKTKQKQKRTQENQQKTTKTKTKQKTGELSYQFKQTTTQKINQMMVLVKFLHKMWQKATNVHMTVFILYNYSLLLRSMRVFMDLKIDIHRSL